MKYGIAIYLSAALGSMGLGGAAAAQEGQVLTTPSQKDTSRIPPSPRPTFGDTSGAYLVTTGIVDADYPVEAWRRGEEGSVAFALSYDSSGRVTGCEIRQSSGSASLDAATCPLLYKRAVIRFDGGWDGQAGTLEKTHVWRRREPDIEVFDLVVAVTIGRDGTATDCEIIAASGQLPRGMSDNFARGDCLPSGQSAPYRDANGEPEERRLKLSFSVEELPLDAP
ncbi:TonB family protein [Alteriqipengyuania flavescens]|uniref:TonB family protein n=1 Tax=Alteriqipengyuania flavescens TaxID=3053610 RepID=UPI0025B57430|nr:TonB family protein [Alteriqipengyuania flavescens]WJY18501.1 TonB family protein [Alteriqipengyuania flavescens]WJY24441.1 TonB family protein [Alteriqipengyuania flavescens]